VIDHFEADLRRWLIQTQKVAVIKGLTSEVKLRHDDIQTRRLNSDNVYNWIPSVPCKRQIDRFKGPTRASNNKICLSLFLSSFQNQVLMIIINSPFAISHDQCWPVINSFHNFRICVFFFGLDLFFVCVGCCSSYQNQCKKN
jgi:hypothetical protein